MKQCNRCLEQKTIIEFDITRKGDKEYRRHTCSKCKNSNDYKRTKETGRYDERKIKSRQQRHDPQFRVRYIIRDALGFDKVNRLENDLDSAFVFNLIENGCFYCGEPISSTIKIGLDRIDNNRGHLRSNVNACCTRCNFIRRNMPYEAWTVLVPAIRVAVQRGLMDNWNYGITHHRRKQEVK